MPTYIILDANLRDDVLSSQSKPEFSDLRNRLVNKGTVRLAYGGKNRVELQGNHKVARLIAQLRSAGRAILVPDDLVNARTIRVTDLCKSDDPHVIALGQLSNVRILVSNDELLAEDFKSKHLIDNPRGKVFQSNRHTHLLRNASVRVPTDWDSVRRTEGIPLVDPAADRSA